MKEIFFILMLAFALSGCARAPSSEGEMPDPKRERAAELQRRYNAGQVSESEYLLLQNQ
jgi:uncharacterized membrane protein